MGSEFAIIPFADKIHKSECLPLACSERRGSSENIGGPVLVSAPARCLSWPITVYTYKITWYVIYIYDILYTEL